MTAIDWVLLAILLISALFGAMRGLVGVIASLAAWLLGGWAAFRFGGDVATLLAGGAAPGTGQLFAGYALSFLGVMIVVGLVGWLVRKLLHSVGLSGLDRTLGLVFGLVRGAFVACVLVLLLGFTSMPREPEWQASRLVPLVLPGAQWLRAWLPDWASQEIDFSGVAPVLQGLQELQGPAAQDNEPGTALPAPLPPAAAAADEQPQDP